SMPVRDLLALDDTAADRLLDLRLGYTETRGAPSLREAIAAQYPGLGSYGLGGAGLGADGVLVHAGAEEGILNLCLAILQPDDRVVVNWPCYQSLAEIPSALGCEVVPWHLREVPAQGGGLRWTLDPGELPDLSGGRAKLIVLNMPHNPTGALLTRQEFEAVVSYARKTGAVLLVDEVYRRLERDPSRMLPSVCEAYENGVALDVMSKHSGLAGLRIGWLASGRADILDAVAQIKDYNSICSSGPSEVLAEVAIRNLDRIVARNRDIVEHNLLLLDRFFEERPDFATWTPPEGSSVAFPRLADGSDAELLAEALVAEAGVLLLPGKYYQADPARFRIGFGRANMPEALGKLATWLDR
ncbi:MAG: pyridoxal phosphate-dependent aminotransferase, partial [Spirochaetota bacterium]